MTKMRVLEMSGSFYDMGKQHGETFHDAIHEFTEDRIQLSGNEKWTGRSLSREAVLALADACVLEHERYAPELMDEVRGMADATGLSLGALIISNGYTDFIDTVYSVGDITQKAKIPQFASDNCTAFLVPKEATADGQGMYGQTWDMHDTATPNVVLLQGKPDNAPNFLAFTSIGCVGMIGMNEHGIAVGINNIMAADGQIGVMWPFVIRKILMQDNIDDALSCLIDVKLAGAHNYLIMDKNGRGYNVEAMPTRFHIAQLDKESIVHTNHCLIPENHEVERKRTPESQANSQQRLSRAQEMLERDDITPQLLMEVTRHEEVCQRSQPPMHVESSGAAIMRPATGDFWAVWGLPPENEYEHFTI
ncbi:MAG: C45 family peptidase [Anaerolineae bacterium]|nr:C45 family peptidase [Anaerolineae bacterium]